MLHSESRQLVLTARAEGPGFPFRMLECIYGQRHVDFQVSHGDEIKIFSCALVTPKLIVLTMFYKCEKSRTQSAKCNPISFQLHEILHLKYKSLGGVRNNKVLHLIYSYTSGLLFCCFCIVLFCFLIGCLTKSSWWIS